MRPIPFLVAGMLIAAFVAGALALSYRIQPESPPDFATIAQIRKEFTDAHPALERVDLGVLFPSDRGAILLDPASHFPSSAHHPFGEVSALHRYSKDCDAKNLSFRAAHSTLGKAWIWHEIQCGRRVPLPPRFFEEKPWLHPSGSSFVYLAWKDGSREFNTLEWLKKNMGFAHALEYAQFPEASLSDGQKLVASLDRNALSQVFGGAPLVLSSRTVWMRAQGFRENSSLFDVYPLDEFRKSLQTHQISLTPSPPGRRCLLQEGNACWEFDFENLTRKARAPSLLLTLLTLLLAGLVAWKLLRIIRRNRLEEERKRFALQTLAHELRTPVTGLALSAETLRSHFDEMPGTAQDATMRILDEIQRLLRLVERSRSYLTVSGKSLIQLNPVIIPSMKRFLEELLPEAGSHAFLEVELDQAIRQDPYWLAIAVRNIFRNACQHGKPPIRIRLKKESGFLRIEVSDEGKNAVLSEESKSGWGMGLLLVRQILEELGGHLEFHSSPTTFTLVIPHG